MPDQNVPTQIIPGRGPKREPESDKPVGFEQLTAIGATAKGLASIPANADKAIMIVENATLGYRDDGTDPTADIGLKVFIAGTIILNSRDSIDKFKAIRTGGTSSEVNVSYYTKQ